MGILVPACLVLVTLAICPGLLFHYDITTKVLGVMIPAVGASALVALRPQALLNLFSDRRGQWFAVLTTLQIACFAVSTAFSSDPQLSLFGATWRRDGLFTHAAVLLFSLVACSYFSQSLSHVRNTLRWLSGCGALLSLYITSQYLGFDPLIDSRLYRAGEGPFQIVRPPGTFGNANYAAAWLAMVATCSLALYFIEEARWPRWLAAGSAFLAGWAVLLTGSRSALLGLGIALFVTCFVNRIKGSAKKFALAGALVALFFVFLYLPVGKSLRARLHWISDDWTGGARLLLWRDSVQLSRDALWIGTGPETFSLRFPNHQSIQLSREYPDFYHESPHNMFLDELISRGFVGLLLLLAFIAFTLDTGLRLAAVESGRRRLQGALVGTLIGTVVCAQLSVLVPATSLAFYLVSSLILGLAIPCRLQTKPKASIATVCGIAVIASAFVIAFSVYSFRLVTADYLTARSEIFLNAGDFQSAQSTYAKAVRWRLAGGSDDVVFSRLFLKFANRISPSPLQTEARSAALQYAERSVRFAEDRPNAWYNLAELLAMRNDAAGVERSLRMSISWSPNWFKPHWKLAEVLAIRGETQAAATESGRAMDLDAGKHDEVSKTDRLLRNNAVR